MELQGSLLRQAVWRGFLRDMGFPFLKESLVALLKAGDAAVGQIMAPLTQKVKAPPNE